LISVQLGGSLRQASSFALGLIYILGLAFLIFIIASTEYHFKHGGKPESWRLFGWTLGVEAAVIILYYIL
jgi:hypothetical protein